MNKNTLQQNTDTSISRAVKSEKRLSFLCPHHRDWVYFNSQDAQQHLDQIQIKGEILMEHHKWAEALPLIGCAWETTEILLQLYSGEKTFLVNRLGCLTVLLCRCMEQLGHKECADLICEQTRSALAMQMLQMEQNSEKYNYLQGCIEQLKTPERFQVHFLSWPSNPAATLH